MRELGTIEPDLTISIDAEDSPIPILHLRQVRDYEDDSVEIEDHTILLSQEAAAILGPFLVAWSQRK